MRGAKFSLALPILAGLAVFAAHGWLTMYPSIDQAASRWVQVENPGFGQRLNSYYGGGGFWLGYCYGVATGFGLWSLLDWLRKRREGLLAAGGLTLSGAIAGFACFMTGCCGSPMLGVWIGVFGAASAPFLGPAAALLTTLSVALLVFGGWRKKRSGCESKTCDCNKSI